MELSREYPLRRQGLLYPLLVIAALAVIVFSILGIAAVSGWMPSSLLGAPPAVGTDTARPRAAVEGDERLADAFQCVECGVIASVRAIERDGLLVSAADLERARASF